MKIPFPLHSTIAHIFNGEYDVDYENPKPVILDIGANIGGFTVWANNRWPNATLHCYEPVKNIFEWLKLNTKDMPNVITKNVAVGEKDEERQLYYGLAIVSGWGSLINKREQQAKRNPNIGELVRVIPANSLPKADIVKIDTEGWEVQILSGITFKPDVYLIEYHSKEDREEIARILSDYILVGENDYGQNEYDNQLGVVKYKKEKTQ